MRANNEIEQLSRSAQSQRMCLHAGGAAQRAALSRRVRSGTFISSHRGLYAEQSYWASLSSDQQTLHMLRSLASLHPHWVFTGPSVAAVYRLECFRSLSDACVTIATTASANAHSSSAIRRIFVTHLQPICHDGLSVVTPERMLVDCAMLYPFRQAMPVFNEVLRRGFCSRDQVLDLCDKLHRDCGPALRLLHYGTGDCENGGESFCFATMIEGGLVPPRMQVEFIDPRAPHKRYRVDFVWILHDGRIIVAEFDGMRKYIDPSMTDWKSTRQVVHEEREREDALRRAGVTTIVRIDYQEAKEIWPMIRKLRDAGVPLRHNSQLF
ncbi:MAG: hypothetical protein LKF49_08500 [Bifidobacterium tibiigranuli]|jgi:hypothetical protein|uniref:hypothetical protein n=1 Tax=Bifidobacterium tibiigranuli TaxID=2172043 RepID=UPI0023545CE1|nr:hypothetical protein [Bifidobacterium tibiigranuli]MCH3975411.1 hypothetical protein [Bifidobacterium tibiigranuli]MCH4189691.1 hypothetical protein [Bifidobacterium tibiigranuli]MCH4204230.1 hypothetical protein [Bifidobacterium tibiigranuli]MCH4274573.1 hypothetical protein [Bifidobacterium tibiigranuli]MCI1791382.1 hypothetical protein [Bifidobacterium tibiigranuli]